MTAIVLAALAVVLPFLLWSRVRGPLLVRGLARLAMVGFAQITAMLVVFVAVNNAHGLFTDWDDVLGRQDHVEAALDLGPDGLGGRRVADLPRTEQSFRPVDPSLDGRIRTTLLKGQVSGVTAEVYVWLPPQYDDPAYRDVRFPVVELFSGFPGTPSSWFAGLRVTEQLEPLMRDGKVAPFILVSPRTRLLGDQDAGCANVPGVVNAESWVSVDVRKMVTDNFRAVETADGWAAAGFSAGGHCAAKVALAHPDRYRYAVSMSGYHDPAAEPASITGKDRELRQANNPLNILRDAPAPPRLAMLYTGDGDDGYRQGLDLRAAAEHPTRVEVRRVLGGHRTSTWANEVPAVFTWLTSRLEGAGAAAGAAAGTSASHR
ncbi:esterase family protein [Streptomyces sp. TRM49041]|uniref:alpha/beta hydrolase n=1 Tax=Streptomyces sp. TRM49041 TaxID=2603216 RepID=UPI0021CD1122|nr:esterase family protein [Streptomyces sp. TRM49041]